MIEGKPLRGFVSLPNPTSHKRDHQTLSAKVSMRRDLIGSLPRPLTILEPFAGTGILWRSCYDFPGIRVVAIEQHPRKVEILAHQRPTSIVVEGDCVPLLSQGFCAWVPFDVLDLDAHGSPLGCLMAFFAQPRAMAHSLWIVATDGVGFALRRGSCPSTLQESLRSYGRDRLLKQYPVILHAWLETLSAAHGRVVKDFRWRVAGSSGQLYHWMACLTRASLEG